jgi:hypothetical protein
MLLKKSVLTRQQENGMPKGTSGRQVSAEKRGIFYTPKIPTERNTMPENG